VEFFGVGMCGQELPIGVAYLQLEMLAIQSFLLKHAKALDILVTS